MSKIIKPQPLILGGKPHYTLSSYGPVSVEVNVPRVTDEEIELMVDQLLEQAGGTRANLNDPAWMRVHLDGISDVDRLREALRDEVRMANEDMVEQDKTQACLDALAERLGQSVLESEVQAVLDDLVLSFEQDAGTSIGGIAAQMGESREDLNGLFREAAERMAAQEAALSAYADEKKLTVDESEYARLLGLPPAQAEQILAQARAYGEEASMRRAALYAKAESCVLAECTCAYHHETEQEAAERVRKLRRRLGMDTPSSRGFKLV